ncbi:MAG: proton-conducting transporter membrane subunit [Conexivisphaerales archaeon]
MHDLLFITIIVLIASALALPFLQSKKGPYVTAGISAALASYWAYSAFSIKFVSGTFIIDHLTEVVAIASLFAGAVIALSYGRLERRSSIASSMLLIGILGTILLASTLNPLVILASWGLLSIASYGIAAIPKDKKSLANSLKYAFMGGLSLQFLLIAIFLIFSGTLAAAAMLGFAMLLVATGFKVGVVPFHMWLPDVYGTTDPISVSTLSAIMKLGPLALVLRIMFYITAGLSPRAVNTLLLIGTIIALLTMTWGNVTATVQNSVQRILAYSSISHVGFILMGLVVAMASYYYGINYYFVLIGIFVYFFSYSISKTNAFTYIRGFSDRKLESLKGAGLKYGTNSAMFSLSLLNLLGLPPLLGFWGKLLIFMSAANPALSMFFIGPVPWFTIIAIINSVISAFYYVKIIQQIYADGNAQADFSKLNATIIISGLFLLVAGFVIPIVLSI